MLRARIDCPGAKPKETPMLPKDPMTTVQTTLGDLAEAFYEEALAELGDERLARSVSAQLIEGYLRRGRI